MKKLTLVILFSLSAWAQPRASETKHFCALTGQWVPASQPCPRPKKGGPSSASGDMAPFHAAFGLMQLTQQIQNSWAADDAREARQKQIEAAARREEYRQKRLEKEWVRNSSTVVQLDDYGPPQFLRDPEEGKPFQEKVDCKDLAEDIARLKKGLPLQDDWLKRAEERLAQAESGRSEARGAQLESAKGYAFEKLKESAGEVLKSQKVLKARIKAMKAAGVDKDTRRAYLEKLAAAEKNIDGFLEIVNSLTNEKQLASEKISTAKTRLGRAKDYLQEAIFEEEFLTASGEKLASTVGGPIGGEAFKLAALSIDLGYQQGLYLLNVGQVDQASRDLATLRYQKKQHLKQISDKEKLQAEFCVR